MVETRKPVLAGAVIAALLSLPGAGTASAQQGAATPPAASHTVGTAAKSLAPKPVPPLRLSERSLAEVAAELTKATGVLVIADSSVAQTAITLETNGGSLSDVLAEVAKQLPKGTILRHLALPAYKPMPQGDAIVRFLSAEDALMPMVGPLPEGAGAAAAKDATSLGGEEIEVLGRRLSP